MDNEGTTGSFLLPPKDEPQFQYNDWFPVQGEDATVQYLEQNIRNESGPAAAWEAARLSSAVYVFRESNTRSCWLAKYYGVKVGEKPAAVQYARREMESTRRAAQAIQTHTRDRVPEIYACTQGTLFMEYVQGLTLADFIAVRRSRPGALPAALQQTAALLAALHADGEQVEKPPAYEWAQNDVRKYCRELYEHGVLEGNRLVYEGLLHMLDRWQEDQRMDAFPAVYVHGDATSSNFVFCMDDQLVAIDWERMHVADPALDLGRMMAEIGHSVSQQGGDVAEAQALIEKFQHAYERASPPAWNAAEHLYRAKFYRASSILRIARNGWIPRQERLSLVTQAMGLLSTW